MKFLLALFLLFACSLSTGFINAQDASKAANSYEALVERAKNKDQTLDFRQLRFAYADSTAPKTDTDEDKKAMMKAMREKDFAAVIKHADVVLASNYADMDAHFVEYVAHKERKEDDLAALHKFIFQGLLNSIIDSGDGKSPETAYVVIDVHEEYVVLHFMGVGMPKSQSYLHKNGHAYDAIVFIDPKTNAESTVYFNVDIPAKHGL
ncbi:MAG TPA: DUF4919 domain-containing protein [Candidatus Acidoferrum sp.]|nr:DUF4919 domain-containing protein [Candidatus Acidoferrum sp.]